MSTGKNSKHRLGEGGWAAAIGALRKRLGKTQEQFAGLLGVTRASASYWESGRSKPSAEIFIKMGNLAGPDILAFLEYAGLDSAAVTKAIPALEESLQLQLVPSADLTYVPLLSDLKHVGFPALAPAAAIERRLPFPAAFIPNPAHSSCIRIPDEFATMRMDPGYCAEEELRDYIEKSKSFWERKTSDSEHYNRAREIAKLKGRPTAREIERVRKEAEESPQPLFDKADIILVDSSQTDPQQLWEKAVAVYFDALHPFDRRFDEEEPRTGVYVGWLKRPIGGLPRVSAFEAIGSHHFPLLDIVLQKGTPPGNSGDTERDYFDFKPECRLLGRVLGWFSSPKAEEHKK